MIGEIDNYIIIGTMTKFLSNLTRANCICQMTQSNALISAINYFSQNQTCQLFFSNNNSMIIEYQVNSTLIFINQSIISIQTNIHQLLQVARQQAQVLPQQAQVPPQQVEQQQAQLHPQLQPLPPLPQIAILKDDIYIIFCNSILAPPSTACIDATGLSLYNNQFIYSPATQVYAAGMLNNTFGVYKAYGYQNVTTTAIWLANQNPNNSSVDCFLALQTDRNLVVYTLNGVAVWANMVNNGGSGNPFCLEMLDSGNLIWIDRNATVIWQTNTEETR
ncbi:unnamed protein product [Adineta steineri]|uniref:Bulb-type lectin domain-containing protein n=1 Tax=Adineta steineri TaxID=433720 RepID=A0A814STG0_9BILA|nr:unnamed protein product [Adineta steineri]CAF1151632.1 unnamed protein product [Adineta steineri]CAF3830318.1 unnamed protein product [Adineta steineri]CAF4129540.1 unnamed protein product [Adineta steineri]